jgi:hypothetical protein
MTGILTQAEMAFTITFSCTCIHEARAIEACTLLCSRAKFFLFPKRIILGNPQDV